MRLLINGEDREVLSIVRTGYGDEFALHFDQGLTGTHRLMKEWVLGDQLRARFDFLERRVECGELEYVVVKDEMDEIAQALVDHHI